MKSDNFHQWLLLICINANYSGPSEGSPSNKMDFLFFRVFFLFFHGHGMKKKCEE